MQSLKTDRQAASIAISANDAKAVIQVILVQVTMPITMMYLRTQWSESGSQTSWPIKAAGKTP